MAKIVLFALFFIMFLFVEIFSVKKQKEPNPTLAEKRLSTLGAYQIFDPLTMSRRKGNIFVQAEKKFTQFLEKLETQENERKTLQDEVNRRKIFQKFLLAFQQGSQVLRDFHTIRY